MFTLNLYIWVDTTKCILKFIDQLFLHKRLVESWISVDTVVCRDIGTEEEQLLKWYDKILNVNFVAFLCFNTPMASKAFKHRHLKDNFE